jgi:hypothetical protein
MKAIRILSVLAIILLAIACNDPYWFVLNNRESNAWLLHGYKMCDMDSVEVYADDAFYMRKNTMVSLHKVDMTQFEADFTITLTQGRGVNFYLRSVRHNFENHNQIKFEYNTDGCGIYENGDLVRQVDTVVAETNEAKRVIFKNFTHSYLILVDCDTVYYGRTNLPQSEYIIIESKKSTEIDIRGITFTEIPDYEDNDYVFENNVDN